MRNVEVNDKELKKLVRGYKSLLPEGRIMSNLNVLLVREQLAQVMERSVYKRQQAVLSGRDFKGSNLWHTSLLAKSSVLYLAYG